MYSERKASGEQRDQVPRLWHQGELHIEGAMPQKKKRITGVTFQISIWGKIKGGTRVHAISFKMESEMKK